MGVARLGLSIVLLGGLVAGGPAFAGKKDNSVRFGDPQVLDNADPYFNSVRIGVIFSHHVWDTLIYRDPNDQRIQAAGSRPPGNGSTTQTLEMELRRGVKFHNGAEFSADDVVYTLNFVSNPDNKAIIQGNVNWIARAEKLDTLQGAHRHQAAVPGGVRVSRRANSPSIRTSTTPRSARRA